MSTGVGLGHQIMWEDNCATSGAFVHGHCCSCFLARRIIYERHSCTCRITPWPLEAAQDAEKEEEEDDEKRMRRRTRRISGGRGCLGCLDRSQPGTIPSHPSGQNWTVTLRPIKLSVSIASSTNRDKPTCRQTHAGTHAYTYTYIHTHTRKHAERRSRLRSHGQVDRNGQKRQA